MLDLNDRETATLYRSWDIGDCSLIGLIRILLIQEINNEIKARDKYYYDGQYDEFLEAVYTKYQS